MPFELRSVVRGPGSEGAADSRAPVPEQIALQAQEGARCPGSPGVISERREGARSFSAPCEAIRRWTFISKGSGKPLEV